MLKAKSSQQPEGDENPQVEEGTVVDYHVQLRARFPGINDLFLDEGEVYLIGRNPITQIRDHRCSRKQLDVWVKEKGATKVLVKKCEDSEGDSKEYGHGDILNGPGFSYEIRFRQLEPHPYCLQGYPAPPESVINQQNKTDDIKTSTKRPISNEIDSSVSRKRLKINEKMKQDDMSNEKNWVGHEGGHVITYVYKGGQTEIANRVVAMDFDGTIVDPKSGAKFAKSADDWKLKSVLLPSRIRNALDREPASTFVIFSNQNGLATGKVNERELKERFEQVCKALDIPCFVFLAPEDDEFRKPRPGMWNFFVRFYNNNKQPSLQKSVFIGDALGRRAGKTKDHSAADLLFAHNLGLPVLSPEDFISGKFAGHKYTENELTNKFTLPKFIARTYIDNVSNAGYFLKKSGEKEEFDDLAQIADHMLQQVQNQSCLIILVGLPASGKTTFYHRYLKPANVHWINRDTLSTMEKCLKHTENILKKSAQEPQLLCIDNMNVDKTSRRNWISLAKKHKVKVATFCFNVSVDHCLHNELFRRLYSEDEVRKIPRLVFYKEAKRMEEPTFNENLDFLYFLNFFPKFSTQKLANAYEMYLHDK